MSELEARAERLVRRRLAAEPERLANLLAEVEAEAWQEVRTLLRRATVTALLEELGHGGVEIEEQENRETDISPAPLPPCCSQVPPLGTYVYGIVDRTQMADLAAAGVAPDCPVTLQSYRDLAAVVSRVPLEEFGEEALKANLADMDWLSARVRAHQAVLDAVLPLATVVPMKFATIYYSPVGVEEFLAARYDQFVALLDHLRGRQEWGLKLYGDETELAAHIAEVSPDVQRLRAEIESKPRGAAYLLAGKLREVGEREVERIGLEVADNTHAALVALSVAERLNPLQGPEITGRAERMLLNGAYLVDDAALDAFKAALDEKAAAYGNHGFRFELTGPWPAYNFVALPAEASGVADG